MSYFFNLFKRESRNENSQNSIFSNNQGNDQGNDQVQGNEPRYRYDFYTVENAKIRTQIGMQTGSFDFSGFRPSILMEAKIPFDIIIKSGVTVEKLLEEVSPKDLINYDYRSLPYLIDANVELYNLGSLGCYLRWFGFTDSSNIESIIRDYENDTLDPWDKRAYENKPEFMMFRSINKELLLKNGASVSKLLDVGFSPRYLVYIGFPWEDLKDGIGSSLYTLRKSGFSAKELKEAGFSNEEIANLSEWQIL